MYDYESTSHVHEFSVWVTSPSIWVTPICRVALGPWPRPMASHTSSMLLMTIQMERSTSLKQSMYAVDVTAESSHLGQCACSALPQDCPAVCGTRNVRTRRAGLCAGTSSANCPLRKPCETCETLRSEKPICKTLRKFYLRKLAKTCICETLRILQS